jgi:hypothetical protein
MKSMKVSFQLDQLETDQESFANLKAHIIEKNPRIKSPHIHFLIRVTTITWVDIEPDLESLLTN